MQEYIIIDETDLYYVVCYAGDEGDSSLHWNLFKTIFNGRKLHKESNMHHFPFTDEENLLLYYLGWIMSGGLRFVANDFNLSYQFDPTCQKALDMIMSEFDYSFNDIWNLCRDQND